VFLCSYRIFGEYRFIKLPATYYFGGQVPRIISKYSDELMNVSKPREDEGTTVSITCAFPLASGAPPHLCRCSIYEA